MATPGSSPRVSLQESSPPSQAKDRHRNSSPDCCSQLSSDPGSKKSNSKLQSKVEDLTKELVEVKTHRAEAATQLEQKKMELKQALQREALVLRELQSAKQYIGSLEQRVRQCSGQAQIVGRDGGEGGLFAIDVFYFGC